MVQPNISSQKEARPPRMGMVWLLYFFQFASVGVFFTFLNVYFHEAGLSGTEIGLLNMVTALVGVGSSIAWGYLSDRTGNPRLWIILGAVGAMLAAQFIPYAHGFWAFLWLSTLSNALNSAPMTLVDSTTLVLLGKHQEEYGRYRLGGSFGYILAGTIAGFIFEQAGLRLMFPAYAAVMIAFSAAALWLPPVTVRLESRGAREIGRMIRQPAWLLFMTCFFLCWIASNAALMFLNVSLSALGASQGLIGLVWTVPAIVELPFMFYSGRFLRRFGPLPLMIAAMVMMVARFFLLGWMPTPGWAIAINLLNGPSFVFFWNSSVTYANSLAPKGMAATAQGLLTAATSLARVASALLSGWLFDWVGPRRIYVVMGFLVLAALILFYTGTLDRNRKGNNN